MHYHYGTLGQLEHGVNYADAYLTNIGQTTKQARKLEAWPYAKESLVKLFILAGHRNMEGERAFVQELEQNEATHKLAHDSHAVAYKYSIGGDFKKSEGWEPLGPAGFYDTFGPELSFASALQDQGISNIAIAKFTHSGSQIIDWTPEGSEAKSRNLYEKFITFVRDSVQELETKGHSVEIAGIFYHLGENDMSWGPFREQAALRVNALVGQSRRDLNLPALRWFVSQQPPTDDADVNRIDVTAALEKTFASDMNIKHIKAFELPRQREQLVLDTSGIVRLGEILATAYVQQ